MSNARDLADLGKSAEAIDIDASAPADSLNIDSSGNLLVGQSSTVTPGLSNTTTGLSLTNNGYIFASKDGDTSAWFNRNTTDGSIINLRKDGTTVGSIGAKSSDLTIGTSDTGIRFLDGADSVMPVNPTTGADSDDTLNLGVASARWKDLYLSGGVYVGGTGGANYLDDYEEGTWTPTTNSGTLDYAFATYTKVGRIVVLSTMVYNFSDTTSSNGLRVNNLPFASSSGTRFMGSTMMQQISTNTIDNVYLPADSTTVRFYATTTGNFVDMKHSNLNSGISEIYLTITYFTNA